MTVWRPLLQTTETDADGSTDWVERAGDTISREIADTAENTADFLFRFIDIVVGAAWFAIVLVIVLWLGRKGRRWFITRFASRWHGRANVTELVDNLIRIGIFLMGVVLALGLLGVRPSSLVTIIGVIVAALSIALQDMIKNLAAGFYLLIEQPFAQGDRLVVAGDLRHREDGVVERVNLRVTALRNRQRQLVLVPNYTVFSQVVLNKTAHEPYVLYLQVARIDDPPRHAEREIEELISRALGEGCTPPLIDLMRTSHFGTALDVRIWFPRDHDLRRNLIVGLHERYPDALIEVVEG